MQPDGEAELSADNDKHDLEPSGALKVAGKKESFPHPPLPPNNQHFSVQGAGPQYSGENEAAQSLL